MDLDAESNKGTNMSYQLVTLLISLLISLAAGFTAYYAARIFLQQQKLRSQRKILAAFDSSTNSGNEQAESASGALLVAHDSEFSRGLLGSNYGKWLRRTASKAGIWQESEVVKLVNQKLGLGITALIFALITRQLANFSYLYPVLIPALAFFLPDLLLKKQAAKRIKEIERSLPDAIDLLAMCVSAGIGFQAGMQRVANTQDNPLSEEFSRVLAEMKLGQGRADAFQAMSDRLGIESLTHFVNSVLQVEKLGVPITKVLSDQSKRIRGTRREKAREQAQKLPVKILAPIMVFMLPALLIIILGPAVVSIMRAFL